MGTAVFEEEQGFKRRRGSGFWGQTQNLERFVAGHAMEGPHLFGVGKRHMLYCFGRVPFCCTVVANAQFCFVWRPGYIMDLL